MNLWNMLKKYKFLAFSLVAVLISVTLIAATRMNSTHLANKSKVKNYYEWNGPITFRTYKKGTGSETAIAAGTKYATLHADSGSYLKTDIFRPNSGKFTTQWQFYGDTVNAMIECKTACLGDSGATSVSESRYTTTFYNTNASAAVTTQDSIYDKSTSDRYMWTKTCTFDIGHADAFFLQLNAGDNYTDTLVVRGNISLKEIY